MRLLIVILLLVLLVGVGFDLRANSTITEQHVETLSFSTTFEPWPIAGWTRENVTLQVVHEKQKPLASFPVSRAGVVAVDLRSLRPPSLRPLGEPHSDKCGIVVSSYSPPNLAYASAEFQLINSKGAVKSVGFGKPYNGLTFNRLSTTSSILVINAPGRVEGVFKCSEVEIPANLTLERGVNYLSLEGLKWLPFTRPEPDLVAAQKIAYNDPYVFPEAAE